MQSHEKKYIMIGSPSISNEIFRKVLRPLNNYEFKPNGGFWASNYIDSVSNISEWYNYLLDADGIAYYKNMKDGVIFTLEENANILTIDNEKQICELAKKYPSYHYLLNFYGINNQNKPVIDFEKLSEDYDGIYIDYDKILINTSTNVFQSWSINTLLLFNLECIKEYKSVEIKNTEYDYYKIPYIDKMSETKKVKEKSNYYNEIYKYVEMVFNENISKYNKIIFNNYDEYLDSIIKCTNKCIEILYQNQKMNIKEIQNILKSENIKVNDILIIRNVTLNYLSSYLKNEKQKIKTLSKSTHTKVKDYKLLYIE